jgi:HdeA/HdeB family
MKVKLAAILAMACVAACAEQTPTPPPPAPVAATPPPASAPTSVVPQRWDVERVRCSDLLEASDEDRAAAAMFYYGYLAAKAGLRVIDVGRIEGNIAKVMQLCEAKPTLTMPQAFRQALHP